MGKVHRIKKAFRRLASHPIQPGNYSLNRKATVHVGKRYNGEIYMMNYSYGNAYKPLIDKLIKQYQDGVAHSD